MKNRHVAFVVSLVPIGLCFGGGCGGCQKTDVQVEKRGQATFPGAEK